MAEYKAVIIRLEESKFQTLGNLLLFSSTHLEFTCKTLELPWLNNQNRISCIPPGEYICRRRKSPSKGGKEVFLITEKDGSHVNGRSYIQIEWGNYYTDILGCILVGRSHTDINGDGFRDVTSSRDTFKELYSKVPAEFPLLITNATELCLQ